MIQAISSRPGVLCAGSIVQDTIVCSVNELRWGTTLFVDTMERHLGGNGANTARALVLLGAQTRLLGTVGNDEAAEFAVRELQSSGVDTSALVRANAPNAATVVLVDGNGNRQFLHRLGASSEVFREIPAFGDELIDGMQHFHLASLFVLPHLRVQAPEMLRRAKAAGLSTSLDVNWDPLGEWLSVLAPCLPHTDILFLNEDESRMLTGTTVTEAAASLLQSHGARTVVQKLSSAGCEVYPGTPNDAHVACRPYRVDAIDSTGAGDCFAGGFLTAYLQGADWGEAAEDGNAAGALSVSCVGAIAGLQRVKNLAEWKAQNTKA